MLACAACFFDSPGVISTLALFGCWAPWAYIWRPLRLVDRMDRVWGIPKFQISDFISLMLMLMWPILLVKVVRDSHPPQQIIVCFTVFSCCIAWLWLRGLWVLQQFQIRSFARRGRISSNS